MTTNRMVVESVSRLLQRVDALETQVQSSASQLKTLEQALNRLAKEQYKSNLLQESKSTEQSAALDLLKTQRIHDEGVETAKARLDLIQAFLPIIDTVELGLKAGIAQLRRLQARQPEAAKILYAWLQGQRLLRERLLALLAAEEVYPLEALGRPFDPYQHLAVKTGVKVGQAANSILKVERNGYRHRETILRYAEVIVNKPEDAQK